MVSWRKLPLPNYRSCGKVCLELLWMHWSQGWAVTLCSGCAMPLSSLCETYPFPDWKVSAFFPFLNPFKSPDNTCWGGGARITCKKFALWILQRNTWFSFFFLFPILLFCCLSDCQGVWTNFLTALTAAASCCCPCISAFSRYPSCCVDSRDVPLRSMAPHLLLVPPIHHSDCSDTEIGRSICRSMQVALSITVGLPLSHPWNVTFPVSLYPE